MREDSFGPARGCSEEMFIYVIYRTRSRDSPSKMTLKHICFLQVPRCATAPGVSSSSASSCSTNGSKSSEVDGWCNLRWLDNCGPLKEVIRTSQFGLVNHFPGMSELARKSAVARNLKRLATMFPKGDLLQYLVQCLKI